MPVGSQKCRLFVFPVPWTASWVPVWMTGVDRQGVVSSHGATNKGEEMSGRVRLDGGLCEGPLSPLSGQVTSCFMGPSWPNEMTFVELLLT